MATVRMPRVPCYAGCAMKHSGNNEGKRRMKPESNLAFDVNPAEGLGSCSLKVTLGFAHLEVDDGVTLL